MAGKKQRRKEMDEVWKEGWVEEACLCAAAALISVSLLVNIVCGLHHWVSLKMIDMAITCLPRWLKAVVFLAILNKQHKIHSSLQYSTVYACAHTHTHTSHGYISGGGRAAGWCRKKRFFC